MGLPVVRPFRADNDGLKKPSYVPLALRQLFAQDRHEQIGDQLMAGVVAVHAVQQELVRVLGGEGCVHIHQRHGQFGCQLAHGFVVAREHRRIEAIGFLGTVRGLAVEVAQIR